MISNLELSDKMCVAKPMTNNGLFKLKNNDWLEKQRVAGKFTAGALMLLEQAVKDGTTKSMIELSSLAEEYMLDNGCTPTFKGYKDFPAAVCISINEQLVHGIPTDYHLQDGDVVSFDLGATYKGAIADSALTCIYGNPKSPQHVKIINACYESLIKGIRAISVGKKLGVIGHAIAKSVKGNGFNVINTYGGHGLDWDRPHSPPFVENKSEIDKGFRMQPGLAIAIEPMLVPYDVSTRIGEDGWTVFTKEIGSHHEHSVFIHEDRVEIISWRDNEIGSREIKFNV